MRNLLLIPLAFACVALLAACEGTKPPRLAGGGMDMFTPVKMRLHPLSRVLLNPPNVDVEARLEFTDQFGDIGKAVGAISFDLCAYQPLSFDHKGASLDHWSTDIATPQQNQAAWDAITRTYLFKHSVPAGTVGKRDQVVLVATITLPNGEKLSNTLTLPLK